MPEPKVMVRLRTGRYAGYTLPRDKSVAEYLVMTGQAEWPDEGPARGAETATEPPAETPEDPQRPPGDLDDDADESDVEDDAETATEPPAETPDAEGPDIASMTKAELVELAEERGLEVERAEGDGAPLKADYLRALGGG